MNSKLLLFITGLLFTLISCKDVKNNQLDFSHDFPLLVPVENSLYAQWAKKQVLDSILIDDMEKDFPWKVRGIARINYTEERAAHSLYPAN